jgi:hypothetical protein
MQDRCTICAKRTIGSENHFGRIRQNSLVMWEMWNPISVRFESMLVSVQDTCTVFAKRTIGSENHFGRIRWYS